MIRGHERPVAHPDSGTVTAFVVVAIIGLLMAAGMVLDGGRILAARRDAIDQARGAARAGAQAILPPVAGTAATPRIDPVRARALAEAFLARTGSHGEVAISGDTVIVTVQANVSMAITPIGDRHV